MPNTKKSDQKTTAGKGYSANQKNMNKDQGKGHGMTPGAMPHIPTARERAKAMDIKRRGDAQTFEL